MGEGELEIEQKMRSMSCEQPLTTLRNAILDEAGAVLYFYLNKLIGSPFWVTPLEPASMQ